MQLTEPDLEMHVLQQVADENILMLIIAEIKAHENK